MESFGLQELLTAHRATRDTPGWLRLAGLPPLVGRLQQQWRA